MISTEIASRGLDFPDLSHIILFDVPPTITDYGNRVGRSARFNHSGVSLLMLHYSESDFAEKIRHYVPSLQLIEKDMIYETFEKVLRNMNIRDAPSHYIEGLVRTAVKGEAEKYELARKAYGAMLRAYARLPDKHIFAVKKLNLKLLARSFGLNSAQNERSFSEKSKISYLETMRKKRRVESVSKVQVMEYL
jgi:superfamily II DNA/RNA helicase